MYTCTAHTACCEEALDPPWAVSHHVCAGNSSVSSAEAAASALSSRTVFPAPIGLLKFKLSYISSLRPVFYILDPVFKMQKQTANIYKKSLWKECNCREAHSTWLLPRACLAILLNSGIPHISDNATASLASHNIQWGGGRELWYPLPWFYCRYLLRW
jgi:hypothetical protein